MSSIRQQLEAYDRGVGKRTKGFRLGSTFDTSRLSKLGCGGRCVKWYVRGLGMFLVVSGIIVLAVASWAQNNNDIFAVVGSSFMSAVLAMGAFLLLLGTLGLAGALNESKMILSIYSIVQILSLIALLALGGYALSQSKDPTTLIGRGWTSIDNDARVHIQYAYLCCGANWGWSPNYAPQLPGDPCPMEGNPSHPMSQACIPLLASDFKKYYIGFGAVGITIGLILLSGIVSAFLLSKSITSAEEAQRKQAMGGDEEEGY